jgi:hypothetical protein
MSARDSRRACAADRELTDPRGARVTWAATAIRRYQSVPLQYCSWTRSTARLQWAAGFSESERTGLEGGLNQHPC